MAWAHPKYESVVATCGYDGFVKVWKRDLNNDWENEVFAENLGSSVNCIAWAPWEYGLILAAGTAEGRPVEQIVRFHCPPERCKRHKLGPSNRAGHSRGK